MRQIGNVCTNTRKPYPHAVFNPDLFEGEPFVVIEACNSTTGRHGHGKTRIIYRLMFSKKSSTLIVPTSEQVAPWHDHPALEQRTGVVLSTDPLCVRDMDSLVEVQLQVLKMSHPPQVGEVIKYYVWVDELQQQTLFYHS